MNGTFLISAIVVVPSSCFDQKYGSVGFGHIDYLARWRYMTEWLRDPTIRARGRLPRASDRRRDRGPDGRGPRGQRRRDRPPRRCFREPVLHALRVQGGPDLDARGRAPGGAATDRAAP